jgi:hypothetical protein
MRVRWTSRFSLINSVNAGLGAPASNFKRRHPFMEEEKLSSKKRHNFYAFPIRAVSSLPSQSCLGRGF